MFKQLSGVLANAIAVAAFGQQVGMSGGTGGFVTSPVDCPAGQFAQDTLPNGNLVCIPSGSGRKFIFGGGTANGSTSTHYVGVFGGRSLATPQLVPMPIACTITSAAAGIGKSPNPGNSWRVDITIANINDSGGATSTLCTIPGGSYRCSSSGLSIAVPAGSIVGTTFVQQGTCPNTISSQWAVKCEY